MSRHIGIVACSAEGAALCYRTICAEGSRHLGPHAHPEISMHTHSLVDYVACLDRGDIKGIGGLMLLSALPNRPTTRDGSPRPAAKNTLEVCHPLRPRPSDGAP